MHHPKDPLKSQSLDGQGISHFFLQVADCTAVSLPTDPTACSRPGAQHIFIRFALGEKNNTFSITKGSAAE